MQSCLQSKFSFQHRLKLSHFTTMVALIHYGELLFERYWFWNAEFLYDGVSSLNPMIYFML